MAATTAPLCATTATPLANIIPLADLLDAETGEPIHENSETSLVTLHQYSDTENDTLLRFMCGIAEPAEPCSLFVNGMLVSSAHSRFSAPHLQCRLTVTSTRLLMAGTIRIQCTWPGLLLPDGTPFHVALEFHLQRVDKSTPGLSDVQLREGIVRYGVLVDELSWTSSSAVTSEGFTNASRFRNSMDEGGIQILSKLGALRRPETPQQIMLRFSQPLHMSDSGFAATLPYIINPNALPSLLLPEWSTLCPLKPWRTVEELVYSPNPFPMVSLPASVVYSTITQASVELYESSRYAALEQETALKLWSETTHKGTLLQVSNVAIMVVRFRPYKQLGGPNGLVKFDLPERLSADVSFECPRQGVRFTQNVTRSLVPLQHPGDAVFVVGRLTEEIRHSCIELSQADGSFMLDVKFEVRTPRFGLQSQLDTATALTLPDSARWQQVILNQNHDLPIVDLATARISEDETEDDTNEIEEAFEQMLRWRSWNAEQRVALFSTRRAPGGLSLITGPAGCGKSLVLQAMVAFFARIGLHVLVLAPANSNANDLILKMGKCSPEINATRVFPSSRDFSPLKIAQNFDSSGTADLLDFELVRSQANDENVQQYGLSAQVLCVARDTQRDSKYRGKFWDDLRKYIEASEAGAFPWKDDKQVRAYESAYTSAKAEYVALTQVVVTTTGNVRCTDIRDNFASGRGRKCKGIVVILDEAGKDKEVDSLSPLMLFRQKITGFIMLGDERQLQPCNKSAKGRVAFNPFAERIGMSFLTRLKSQGFRCTELVEQHRMSHHISSWPSKTFYPQAGMRDGPGTFGRLAHSQPGLFECLKDILRNIAPHTENDMKQLNENDLDRVVRTQYLVVKGYRDNSKKSAVVREHIKVFFDFCYWPLQAYFGEKLRENVMIVVAYKEALNCWREAMFHLKLPDSQLPNLVTIDSSQGCESSITFIDCSVQRFIIPFGFVDDDKRMNVAMTRAINVRWFLGGDLSLDRSYIARWRPGMGLPSYVKHKEDIKEVTVVGNEEIPRPYEGWIESLTKKDCQVDRRFCDDQ